jgi:fluoride exporter
MQQIILIAIAGSVGATLRYLLSETAHKILGHSMPFGTLLVNIIGSFLIGLVMHISMTTELIPQHWKLPLTTGLLGALTTFSTFSYETVSYIRLSSWHLAFTNIAANVLCCLLATFAGLAAAKTLFPN